MRERFRVLWSKELRENRWKIAVDAAILIAFGILTAVSYGYFRVMLGSSLNSAPVPEMFRDSLATQLGNYANYIWMNWYGKTFYQFGTILAIIVGMGLFSSETSRGTITFLLSRPFDRTEVFAAKFAVGVLALAAPALVATLLLVPAAWLAGHSLSAASLVLGFPVALSGVLVVFAFSVVLSVLIDEPVKAGAAAVGVALLLSLPSWFDQVREFSIYVQMQALPVLQGKGFPWRATLAMLLAAVALYYAGLAAFRAREY